jgi:hypothetical protein
LDLSSDSMSMPVSWAVERKATRACLSHINAPSGHETLGPGAKRRSSGGAGDEQHARKAARVDSQSPVLAGIGTCPVMHHGSSPAAQADASVAAAVRAASFPMLSPRFSGTACVSVWPAAVYSAVLWLPCSASGSLVPMGNASRGALSLSLLAVNATLDWHGQPHTSDHVCRDKSAGVARGEQGAVGGLLGWAVGGGWPGRGPG